MKTGVLLVNLGTPDSPRPGDVRRYLLEFLTDGRVIDFPWLPRNLLVRGIIVPFRYRSSAKLYSEIWDAEKGSPLMYHSLSFAEKVARSLPDDYVVELAMRYRHPSIREGLGKLRAARVDRIIVLPLFPQYASSTTGSVMEAVFSEIAAWNAVPSVHVINSYYDHPQFIRAFAARIRSYDLDKYDHILFSYHGVPERHMRKADETGSHCLAGHYACCGEITGANRFCYRAHCVATTAALVNEAGLSEEQYTICFQSRLGRDPWIQPYTSDVISELAATHKKRLLVVCPAFVADCLETIHEIGVEYREEFEEMGGEVLHLVESLNDSDEWVSAAKQLILESC
jgi:ferrochelatase